MTSVQEEAEPLLDDLFTERNALLKEIEGLKADLAKVDEQIDLRLQEPATKAYDDAGKTHGILNFTFGNHEIKANVTKTVNWDSKILLEAARSMEWEQVQRLFKISAKMDEARYEDVKFNASLGDTEAIALLAKLDAARTVKFSAPKITDIN